MLQLGKTLEDLLLWFRVETGKLCSNKVETKPLNNTVLKGSGGLVSEMGL